MRNTPVAIIAVVFGMLCFGASGSAQTTKPASDRGHRPPGVVNVFNLNVPDHAFDLILARPEKTSVILSVLGYADMEVFANYGSQPGVYPVRTGVQQLKKGTPSELIFNSLKPDTQYFYQFHTRVAGSTEFTSSPEYTFHTARPTGSTFTFTMTADAHLDEHTSSDVYLRTLANIKTDGPDFHIDLGNLFMTDKHGTRDEAFKQYIAQRYYLGQIGTSTPIFLALGTHDGEASRYDDGSADCLAVWSNLLRTRYFPDPVPDQFYSGNATPGPNRSLLQNYYSWEWGDALFIVLDPFGDSINDHGSRDGWGWSLGRQQYQWLKQTLEQSRAKFKFVIIHNLLSGDQASRGGVEIAPFNEWGGKNADGSDGFKDHRPGWDMPVHQLLVKNHVAAVFKAHDNFYARQELDGIVYLMVPQPSFAGNDRIRDLENYGYKKGIFLGNSGHERVTVSSAQITMEYVRSAQMPDLQEGDPNARVLDSCIIR